MKRNGILSVLALLVSSSAQAGECTAIDLRNEALGPNRHQGNIGWCYAYTTADLIAHRYGIPRVSASDVAITYNRHPVPLALRAAFSVYFAIFDREALLSEHQEGFIAIALNQAMKRGACYETDFPSQIMTRLTRTGPLTVPITAAIADVHKQRQTLERTGRTEGDPYDVKNVSNAEFLRILAEEKKNQMFFAFTERACMNNRFRDFGNVRVVYRVKDAGIFDEIDSVLESGTLVGFDYFSGFLRDVNAKGGTLHTSSLVGRRTNPETGACEYLIRNSYGSSCSGYDASLDCEEGNIWAPKELLAKRLIDIAYLK